MTGENRIARRAILTAAPESEAAALADLRRALEKPDPGGRPDRTDRTQQRLAPGVLLVTLPGSFEELTAAMRARPPVFIRHLQPVQQVVALERVEADLDRLEAAARELAPALDRERSFSVQTRLIMVRERDEPESPGRYPYGRFDINERLAAALVDLTGARLDVREPEQVLSVLVTPDTGYLGLSRVEENLSPWAGGEMRFAREPEQVSRSEFKLLEALRIFHLELPATGRALDLGAAPGGWTRLLRRAGLEVTAVDPGDLDPRMSQDPGVRHVRALAQEFRCRRGEFQLIVNDIRMDARDSARLLLEFAPCLSPDGWALMTLKLPLQGAEQVAHQAIGLLHRRYELLGARQLFHNRSEITVALLPRQQAGDNARKPPVRGG